MIRLPSEEGFKRLKERYSEFDEESLETFLSVSAVMKEMTCGMDAYFQQMGISYGRYKILLHLLINGDLPGLSPAQLAEYLKVKRATITGLLDTLEADQWIARQPDPNDRRALIVSLTEAGKAKMDTILPQHYMRLRTVVQDLTAEEKMVLRQLMRKFARGLNHMHALAVSDSLCNADKGE